MNMPTNIMDQDNQSYGMMGSKDSPSSASFGGFYGSQRLSMSMSKSVKSIGSIRSWRGARGVRSMTEDFAELGGAKASPSLQIDPNEFHFEYAKCNAPIPSTAQARGTRSFSRTARPRAV